MTTHTEYRVSLCNSAGELSFIIVGSEKAARDAALDMIRGVPFLCDGDRLVVREIEGDANG